MLPKRTYLWECKVNEETNLYEHSNESTELNTLNKNNGIDIWCPHTRSQLSWRMIWMWWNFILSTDILALSGDALFWEGGGSRNSNEMRLSGMPALSLLISPNLRTNTHNIEILCGSILMYSSMFWVTLADYSTSFLCGGDTGFHDAHMIHVG